MGLDMNLYRKVRLSNDKVKLTDEKSLLTDTEDTIFESVKNVCYWRKFNALHKYFREHFGNEDNDNCVDMYMTISDIKELVERLKDLLSKVKLIDGKVSNGYTYDDDGNRVHSYVDGKVVDKPEVCAEILPTEAGFFFGNLEYDEWYYSDVEKTVEALEKLVSEHDKLVGEGFSDYDIAYYYRAWY